MAATMMESTRGGVHADPPPTMIEYEGPMQIDGPPGAVADPGLPKSGSSADPQVEEVINSILPPR